jgi:hypothetical protein
LSSQKEKEEKKRIEKEKEDLPPFHFQILLQLFAVTFKIRLVFEVYQFLVEFFGSALEINRIEVFYEGFPYCVGFVNLRG